MNRVYRSGVQVVVRSGVLLLAVLAALALAGGAWAHAGERHPDTVLFPLDAERGVERVYGPDRYATAAAVSVRTHPDGAARVVVATGEVFADALAGAAFARGLDAPLLLTRAGELPSATADALEALAPDELVILGGPAAVSEQVEEALAAHAETVTRIGGADRYETAALIAERSDPSTRAFVATGENFPDAIAGATSAAVEGALVLLTRTASLPPSTAAALEELGVSEVTILGGTQAVSADVEEALTDLVDTVSRLGGQDRYDTARIVAGGFGAGAQAFVASGENFPDALTAAPFAAASTAPVVLTRPASAPEASRDALVVRGAELLVVVGGPAAVGDAAVAGLLGAISDEATILGDTHLHGNYGDDDGPNLARYSQLAADRKAAHGGDALFVGGGDELAPSLFAGVFFGRHMVEAFNVSSLDITTMGNHEFDFGPDNFRELIAESEFQWVSANVRETADTDQVFGAAEGAALYDIVPVGDVLVGVTGLGPERMEEVTSMTDEEGVGAVRIETGAALDEVIPQMRADGADLIVIGSHLCTPDARDVADARDDVDLIIGDHCAELLDAPEFRNGTALVFVDDEYDHLGEVTYFLMGGEPVALGFVRHDLDETFPEDPAVRAVIDEFTAELDEELNREIGFRVDEWDTRRDEVRSIDTGIANYIADTMAMDVDADVAIQNGGGIRSDLLWAAGEPILLRDVIEVLPFPNTVVKIEVSGDVIRRALEHGVSAVEDGAGQFPQVSGITYTYDMSQPAGSRVSDIEVNGAPLDDAADYTLATNDFMFGGGDGYDMLAEGEELVGPGEGQLLSTIVANRMEADGDVTVGPSGQRITRLG